MILRQLLNHRIRRLKSLLTWMMLMCLWRWRSAEKKYLTRKWWHLLLSGERVIMETFCESFSRTAVLWRKAWTWKHVHETRDATRETYGSSSVLTFRQPSFIYTSDSSLQVWRLKDHLTFIESEAKMDSANKPGTETAQSRSRHCLNISSPILYLRHCHCAPALATWQKSFWGIVGFPGWKGVVLGLTVMFDLHE